MEINMRDEMEGRVWADHHQTLSNEIDGGLRFIGHAFMVAMRTLNAIEYDAPWQRKSAGKDGGRA